MKVLMLVDTHYQGPKFKGEECDVDNVVARRWIERGIAQPLEIEYEEPTDTVDPKETEVDEIDEKIESEIDKEQEEGEEEDLLKLSSKKLYTMCKDKGLEVEPKQSKEYYIEKLTSEK